MERERERERERGRSGGVNTRGKMKVQERRCGGEEEEVRQTG